MVSILDLADDELPFKIQVGKAAEVDGYPLALDDIFYLFRRFPALLVALTAAKALTPELIGSLIGSSPDILAEIIAASQRGKDDKSLRGDPAALSKAKKLSATMQLQAANTILTASFEEGFGPFDKQLSELLDMFVVRQPMADPASQSPSSSLRVTTAELVGTPPPMRRRRRPESSAPSTSSSSRSTTDDSPTMPRPPVPPEASTSTSPAT
jgi:hypothetical protein